ncbi:unnamed protein product [Adineta ricciae]|uniref:Uncharacterized protein n=1 Tax=Adineta ricciae TaxID=249248 RepID=A0A815QGW3_ADIRI|nr:unnamed protein product [Adineta ricciae]CAF1463115.1 unnamed protein product [Adineta ricciae]
MLKSRFKQNRVTLDGHMKQQWSSVYWNQNSVRPNRIIQLLNDELQQLQKASNPQNKGDQTDEEYRTHATRTSPNRSTTTTTAATTVPPLTSVPNISKFKKLPTIVAGNGTVGNSTRMLNGPWDFSIDSHSNLYISDGNNNRIIKFSNPSGSIIDVYGNLYVSDMYNNRIMKYSNILSASSTPPIIGQIVAGGSYGSNSNQQETSWGVAVDLLGNVYVSDYSNNRVMKWAPGSTTGSLAAGMLNGTGGNGTNQLRCPLGIHVDQNMSLYIADACNGRIQKWLPGSSTGVTVAGANGQLGYPTDVFVDTYGIIYVSSSCGLYRFYPGSTSGTIVISSCSISFGFKLDSVGNVYIADYYNGVINKYTVNNTNCGVGVRMNKILDISSKVTSASIQNHQAIIEATRAKARLQPLSLGTAH